MTTPVPYELGILFFQNRPFHWLKLRFTRHEAWALKAAREFPLFATFAFGTMWVWLFLPAIPIGLLTIFLLENAGMVGVFVMMLLGIGGLVIMIPWYFRWCFICAGLMFGRSKMAQRKEDEISARLERLYG